MAYQTYPKMSLVAQYDDLCRYTQVLTSGPEEEFKVFVENQLKCSRKLKNSELEVKKLHQKISKLEDENRTLKVRMKECQGLLQNADSTRKKIESEKNSLARQIMIIKEVLLADGVMDNQTKEKLQFLSFTCKQNSPSRLQTIEESAGSLLSLSDIDQTDDDLERGRRSSRTRGRRSKSKRSSSEDRACQKKKRMDDAEQFIKKVSESNNIPFIDSEAPSNSDPTSSSPDIPAITKDRYSDAPHFKFNTYDSRHNTDTTPVSRYSVTKDLSKKHSFVTKTLMNRVKCLPCKQNIGCLNKSVKCQVCGIICHPECQKKCPAICFPIVNTPTKGTTGTIADYTSSTSPMIPPLIVHCVREIESRGLKEIGLYRISGSLSQVKSLKEKFVTSRTIPSLCDVDTYVLCDAVKQFLQSLKEPIITQNAWHQFVQAANLQDHTESCYALLGIVRYLPQPNRDTLAFLMLHLQRIAQAPEVKMPIDNLAVCFSPTIVGWSSSGLADADMIMETEYQKKVMKRLLSIPSDSWHDLLSVDTEVFQGTIRATPENLPAPKQTRLGPIYASAQKSKSLNLRKTPITPRNPKYNKGGPTFASPLLR